jgi:hypothetical protein
MMSFDLFFCSYIINILALIMLQQIVNPPIIAKRIRNVAEKRIRTPSWQRECGEVQTAPIEIP